MRVQTVRAIALLAILCGVSTLTRGQETAPPAARPPLPDAKSGDADSIEHILGAVYDVISGPAGPRDWDRFRSLFYEGARLIPSWRDDQGEIKTRTMTPDEYAKRGADYFAKEGFFETSIANRVETWDHMAEVWSTYESRHAKGEKPFARGINSFHLFFDGKRWWILSIYWEDESHGHALPDRYLRDRN